MSESRIDKIRNALIRAGRKEVAPESSPYFETRLLSTIRERTTIEESPWLLWNRVVWRLLPAMAAAVVILASISFWDASGEWMMTTWHDPLSLDMVLADTFMGGDL